MFCSVAAIFGAVSAISSTSRSPPPDMVELSRQAVPVGASRPSCTHFTATVTSPTSLPPMPSVTSPVSAVRASSCGGFVPRITGCGAVKSCVVAAAEQLTSRNRAAAVAVLTSEG